MPQKQCDLSELRDTGILLEINRSILHPIGYDMEITELNDGTKNVSIYKTDDPDGIRYKTDNIPDDVKSAIKNTVKSFKKLVREKHKARKESCGFVVQTLV